MYRGSHELFTKHQVMLREQLFPFLDNLHPLLRKDVVRGLEQQGKLLYVSETDTTATPSGIWALLTFLISLSLNATIDERYAASIAIAVECLICALDLLDDIEDDDPTPIVEEIGSARVLNVSTTLLALANRIILSLAEVEQPAESVVLLLDIVQKYLVAATSGQHLDLLAEQRSVESFTIEECVAIAEGKAGSLMSLACQMGVLSSKNCSQVVVQQFAEMGKLLGIVHQLDNDSHDLYHILESRNANQVIGITIKTDLARKKKTLPLVLAAQTLSTIQNTSAMTDDEYEKAYVDALHESIITTWGMSLLYHERVREIVQQIEVQFSLSHALRLLLGFT